MKGKIWGHSRVKRFLAGLSAMTILAGTIPFAAYGSLTMAVHAEEAGTGEQEENPFLVSSATTKFNLTGGIMNDSSFVVSNGICSLSDDAEPTCIPNPEPPVNSNLVFAGWANTAGEIVTEFQENMTYYANWKYGTTSETNHISNLTYLLLNRNSNFFDLRGNGGSLRTTYGDAGYNLYYKYKIDEISANIRSNITAFDAQNAEYCIGNQIYVTPIFSFSDSKGKISENEQENAFVKITYVIQNRSENPVTEFGLASTADVMIGGNDHAAIYGYSADQTPVTSENHTMFSNVPNIEMHDGSGNIFSLSLSDDGDCWWGVYSSRTQNAYTGHNGSNYSTGYDSGISYSWQNINLAPGETVFRSAVFAAGDIHLFRKHAYDANGYCFGGADCELAIDHADENSVIYQAPIFTNQTYEVRNSGQLLWLSQHMNDGSVVGNANIKLMHDLVFPDDGRISWKPIRNYSGTFDGQGFSISGMQYTSGGEEDCGGIFGTLSGATVRNLGVINSTFESSSGNTGSIAGNAAGNTRLENVYSLAAVTGTKAAGLVYEISDSIVSSVLCAGASDSGHMIYGNSTASTFQCCYYLSEKSAYSDSGMQNILSDDLSSGMVAYQLGWNQNIGEEDYPVLNGDAKVYRYTINHSCSEANPMPELSYTNDESQNGKVVKIEHEYDWGELVTAATCTENEFWNRKCVNCGEVTSETFERVEEGHLATGHTYDWGRVVSPNTCTENAVWAKKCVKCGEELEETFERTDGDNAAKGHRYEWRRMIKPATCTENAVWEKYCVNCGDVLPETFERTDGDNAATGHKYRWGDMVSAATCTENAVWTKKCVNCGETLEGTFERTDGDNEAKGHRYDWGDMISAATCTENAVWTKKCVNCGEALGGTFERTDGDNAAKGHHYDWDCMVHEATCTNNAVWTKKCVDCGLVLEGTLERNDGENAAKGHQYEWFKMISPADCAHAALWIKKCAECDAVSDDTFERTDGGNAAKGHTYGNDSICTVCGQRDPSAPVTTTTTAAPAGVGTTVSTSKTTTTTAAATTEPYARVTSTYDKTVEDAVKKEENRKLNIVGDMTVTPMSKSDIIAAGIDLSDPGNYHCYNYSIEMDFEDVPMIFTKYEAVPSTPSAPEKKKIVISPPSGSGGPVEIPSGGNTYVPEIGASVGYYEYESQEMFIIIYGESKWLKEFYDVQLVLFNSDSESLKDCTATLNVPSGLTLCNSSQTKFIGDLAAGAVSDIHWYLRGDEAGDYSLSARVVGENDGDAFSYDFHSKNNLHVYAGSALKMTIEAPNYSCYGDKYEMKIALTNVSDKPIYDLENKVKNVEHGYYSYKTVNDHGIVTNTSGKRILSSGGATSISVEELKPGESAVIELSITDLWKSPYQKNLELSKLFFDALSIGLSEMPLAQFCASLAASTVDGITVVHMLNNVVVTTLEGSTTEIPYEVVTSSFTDEFIDDHAFSFSGAVIDAAVGSCDSDGVQKIYYNGKCYIKKMEFYSDLVRQMAIDYQKILDGAMTQEAYDRKYNLDYLEHTTGVKLDKDDIWDYIQDVISATGIDDIDFNGKQLPISDTVTIGRDLYKIFSKPKGEINAKIYVTDKNGNIISYNDGEKTTNSVRRAKAKIQMMSAASAAEPTYEFKVLSGDYTYADGVYTLTSDALIDIKPLVANEEAVVHIEYSDGYQAEYPMISVPEHECKGGNYQVIAPPDSANYGTAAQYCETCGKFINSKKIAKVCTAMLSNGEIFQNVYDAARYAEESGEEVELSIFGEITLNQDRNLSDNVQLVVTPYANLTFENSAKILSNREVLDYTNSVSEEVYETVTLNYWEGRTETLCFKYGTEVTELPVQGDVCGFSGWYSDGDYTEPFVPFTAGAGEHSHVYYSDAEHIFGSNGTCKTCGELKNGRDSFAKVGVSVADMVTLKFVAEISENAANDTNAYVEFTFPDGKAQTVRFASALQNADGTYVFRCKIPLNRLSDIIKAQICYSDGTRGSYLEYSVKQYTDYILQHQENYDSSVTESIQALLNLGGYIQMYSGYHADAPINQELNLPLDDVNVVIGDEYKAVKEGHSDNIQVKGASLSISEQASINIQFALKDGADIQDYTFTVDGKTVPVKKSGNYYVISLKGIAPQNYDKMYQFKVASKTQPAQDYVTLSYSCFTYAKTVLDSSFESNVTNLIKAMYFYHQGIENYMSYSKAA